MRAMNNQNTLLKDEIEAKESVIHKEQQHHKRLVRDNDNLKVPQLDLFFVVCKLGLCVCVYIVFVHAVLPSYGIPGTAEVGNSATGGRNSTC